MISFGRRTVGEAQRGTLSSGESASEALVASVVDDLEGLRRLEADWGALVEQAHRPSLCATHAWSVAWWEAFGAACGRLFVVVVREAEGGVVGIVPLFEARREGLFGVRQLRALGFLDHGKGPDMTEEPTLLLRKGREAAAMAEVARLLRSGMRGGRWDAVVLRATDGEAMRLLARGLSPWALGRPAARAGSDYAQLPPTWAEYRRALGKSMRDNLGYYPRLLTRDGHDWGVRIVRLPEEMPAAARRLVELHRARAQSERGPRHADHIAGCAQEEFLAGLLQALARQGRGFVAELVVDGAVVASQAFGETRDELMVYYSGYLEAWSRYSPVFVIDAIVFKDALERGVRRVDFLRGMAPWKARWLAEPGPELCRAVLVSPRPAALARHGLHFVRTSWRRDVAARLPALCRSLGARLVCLTASLERGRAVVLPLLPHLHRVGLRAAPTLHLAAFHHLL